MFVVEHHFNIFSLISEIQFKCAVYPTEIKIFETYNPGAVVKIMACDQLCGTDVDSGQSR